jgi:negative regulator of flagellin synthesis FlgM
MAIKIESSSYPLPQAAGSEGKARATVTRQRDNSLPATAPLRGKETGAANSNAAPVNPSKIAEIKQAIAEGRMAVNASAVADSLIKSVTDLLASQPI